MTTSVAPPGKIIFSLPVGWRLLKPREIVRCGDREPNYSITRWVIINSNSGTEIGRPALGFPVIRRDGK